jgi:hypothetical protein
MVREGGERMAHWLDDPATERAGMVVIHIAAASLIDAVAPALADSTLLELAA